MQKTACSSLIVLLAWGQIESRGQVYDFTGPNGQKDGIPDILWRRRSQADTYIWQMNGINDTWAGQPPPGPPDGYPALRYVGAAAIGSSGTDVNWKIVGAGDFSSPQDGKTDILWQHETQDLLGVWYLSGTTWINSGPIISGGANAAPGVAWRIVAVGDFGSSPSYGVASVTQDGKPDIVLQNRDNGSVAIWMMNGVEIRAGVLSNPVMAGWKIVAAGDFGTSPSVSTKDGKPDLVLANVAAGALAIRYMDGYTQIPNGQVTVSNPFTGLDLFSVDRDEQVVAAGDYTLDQNPNPGTPARTDLLSRHVTDGRQFVGAMEGNTFFTQYQVVPHTWDTDWRMANQDLSDTISTWALNRLTHPSVSSVSTASSITLNIFDYPLTGNETGYYIRRRQKPSSDWYGAPPFAWTVIQANWPSTTCPDNTVVQGTEYQYDVSKSVGGTLSGQSFNTRATANAPIFHARGRVLVIIEASLKNSANAPYFDAPKQTFLQDLSADGWEVIVKDDAPRHDDPNWTVNNKNGVINVKNWITTKLTSDTRAVILLGHVTIPYSGTGASDGHEDHAGPWTADSYYGDTGGMTWMDSDSDGRFDNDWIDPSLELAVGRIDFARLEALGVPDATTTASAAERTLLIQYLNKNHSYRHKLSTALADRAAFRNYSFASPGADSTAKRGGCIPLRILEWKSHRG